MQVNSKNKKQILLTALSETIKEYRGTKSRFMFSSENDIPISVLSMAERGLKDPQLTTLYKLAEASNVSLTKFISKLESKLPNDFSLIDK